MEGLVLQRGELRQDDGQDRDSGQGVADLIIKGRDTGPHQVTGAQQAGRRPLRFPHSRTHMFELAADLAPIVADAQLRGAPLRCVRPVASIADRAKGSPVPGSAVKSSGCRIVASTPCSCGRNSHALSEQQRRTRSMMKIWGRTETRSMSKVMWAVAELGLPHERIEAGGRLAESIPRSMRP